MNATDATAKTIFDNAGRVTLQLENEMIRYAHTYDSPEEAAKDMCIAFQFGFDLFEDHDPDALFEVTPEQLASGQYRVFVDNDLEQAQQLSPSYGGWDSVRRFYEAVRQYNPRL